MRNSWKRFVAWVIGLKNDPFNIARLRLTALYTLGIIVVFSITNVTLFGVWYKTLNQVTPGILGPQIQQELSSRLSIEFGRQSIYIYIALITIIALVSYWISSGTLSPIRNIIRTQKRFIADASHELRTPLAIMKTNSEIVLLDGDRIDPKEAQSALKSNLEEIDRMSKIIENLLAMSYYDNQFTEVPFQEINFSKLITTVTDQTRTLANKKSINLRLLNADPGLIMGNPIAIQQMAINLIKNAVTYTPEGGQVSVSVTAKNTALEFKVKDTGVGIEKKDLSHVFHPFYKSGHNRVQLERESSGLGLTIVKKIVERHRGSIYLNSAVGKGTTIIVTIPLYQNEQLKA